MSYARECVCVRARACVRARERVSCVCGGGERGVRQKDPKDIAFHCNTLSHIAAGLNTYHHHHHHHHHPPPPHTHTHAHTHTHNRRLKQPASGDCHCQSPRPWHPSSPAVFTSLTKSLSFLSFQTSVLPPTSPPLPVSPRKSVLRPASLVINVIVFKMLDTLRIKSRCLFLSFLSFSFLSFFVFFVFFVFCLFLSRNRLHACTSNSY